MPLLLLIAGVAIVAVLGWGSLRTLLTETADDVLETASGSVLTVKERADSFTAPVIEKVEELDRRVDSVQQGLDKLREGANLLREGIAPEQTAAEGE